MRKITLLMLFVFSIVFTSNAQITPPFTETFDSAADDLSVFPNGWTTESNGTVSSVNLSWTLADINADTDPVHALALGIPNVALDEWLFSPEIHLEAGEEYRISFQYRAGVGGPGASLQLHLGPQALASEMGATPIWENATVLNTVYEQGEVLYTPTVDGPVFFGFNVETSGSGIFQILLDTIAFENPDSLSSNQFSSDSFALSPSPAADFLEVRFENISTNASLTIYDVQGKEVLTQNNVASGSRLDINQLVNGVYFVTLLDESGNGITKKISVLK